VKSGRSYSNLKHFWRRFQTIAWRVDIVRAQASGDDEAVVEDMVEISRLANDDDRWSDAQRYSREAKQKAKNLGNSSLQARADFQLALALIGTGDYVEALTTFENAMPELRRGGDPAPLAAGLLNVGLVNNRLGRTNEAAAVWREAATVARSAGDESRLCAALIDLGSLCFGEGQYKAASEHWSEALNIARQLKDSMRMAKATYCLGVVAFRESRFAEADEFLTESRALHQRLGRSDLAARADEYLARLPRDGAAQGI
jgi:tetratricopeptide (TPR) repeat protein